MNISANYHWEERAVSLPPGEWVREGLVWVFNEAPPEARIEHGTERGYQQHRYLDVPKCDECREAHRQQWHADKRVAA